MWRGDYATYNDEVVTPIVELTRSSWISIAVTPRVVGSTLALVDSGQRCIVAATPKTCSGGADVDLIPSSRAATFRWGKRYSFIQILKTGVCDPWPAGQKWPGGWSFVVRGKVQGFQAMIAIFEKYCHWRIEGAIGLRLSRYLVKCDTFLKIIR